MFSFTLYCFFDFLFYAQIPVKTKGEERSHLWGKNGQKGLLTVQQVVLFSLDAVAKGGQKGVWEAHQHDGARLSLGNSVG